MRALNFLNFIYIAILSQGQTLLKKGNNLDVLQNKAKEAFASDVAEMFLIAITVLELMEELMVSISKRLIKCDGLLGLPWK